MDSVFETGAQNMFKPSQQVSALCGVGFQLNTKSDFSESDG